MLRSVPNAYRSIAKPPIRDADHNTVHLGPVYRFLLKCAKCVGRQVKVWNEDSIARLQGCFDCTDWDVLRDSCDSLDELTDVVTSYVSFCVDPVVPCCTLLYPVVPCCTRAEVQSAPKQQTLGF